MVDARAALSQVSTVWRSWPMSTVPVQGWRCMSFRRRPHAPPRSHSLEIRRTGGIPPALEDPGGVDANHAITLVEIYSVAHELASGGVLMSRVHCGNRMASRQHHKLRGARDEERIGRDQKCIGAHLDQLRKGRIDVATGAGIQDVDLLPDAAGGGLNVIQLDFGPRDSSGAHEDSGGRGLGPQLAPIIRLHVDKRGAHTRDVAAGTTQAGDAGRTRREKIVKANPFLERTAECGDQGCADRERGCCHVGRDR